MTSKLLKLKNERRLNNNENIIDLGQTTFEIDYQSPNLIIERVILVNEDMEMRPDLISIAAYGVPDHAEILLKINQISNPFALKFGDLILVPIKEKIDELYKKPLKSDPKIIEDVKAKFLTPDRLSKKDQKRLEKLLKIASGKKNGASEIIPTNLMKKNEKPFDFGGGAIKLSPKS